MPVPKRKRSRARRDKRFANKGMSITTVAACLQCGKALLSHQACLDCGYYKGRKVVATKADRSLRRTEERQAREARQKTKAEHAAPDEGESSSS